VTSPAASPEASLPTATDVAGPSVSDAATDAPDATDGPEATEGATPETSEPDAGAGIPTDPALLGAGLVPDGWQIVEDATNTCRIAVPPDWTTDVAPGTGQSSILAEALGAVSAVDQEWEAYKETVDQFYLTGHVTVIDTDDVFLIANPVGPDFELAYILVLRFDDTNCQVLVTVQGNATAEHGAEAVLIAQTLDHTD
jgi:hypothetical protein